MARTFAIVLSLVAALIVACEAEPTREPPGRNPCTRGPAFWCASFDQADLCNAFDYCLEHVWKGSNSSYVFPSELQPAASFISSLEGSVAKALSALGPTDDNCECEVCKWFISLFDSYVRRNTTQALIEGYYNKMCLNLPEPMRPQCTQVVEKHFMLLISAFGKLDPTKACKDVCSAVHLAKIDTSLSAPVNTCLCQLCQEAIQIIDQELMKPTIQSDSVNEMVRLCGFVSPANASSKCEQDAKKFIPELYSLLSHMDPLRTCDRFAFCKASEPFKPTLPPVIAATTRRHIPCLSPDFVVMVAEAELGASADFEDTCACESCKYYVGQVNSCLQRNSTQNLINTFYHKLCQNLPPAMQAECNNVVSKHFSTLIHDVSDLDPVKACKNDCQQERGVGDAKTTNSCLCRECQAVIQDYAQRMSEQQYQTEAITYFTMICRYMPSDEGVSKCVSTAKDYLPELMNMLSHVDPASTCSHFKYCQKKV